MSMKLEHQIIAYGKLSELYSATEKRARQTIQKIDPTLDRAAAHAMVVSRLLSMAVTSAFNLDGTSNTMVDIDAMRNLFDEHHAKQEPTRFTQVKGVKGSDDDT